MRKLSDFDEYKEPGIVIASGGIDSVTLAYLLARNDALEGIVSFDYGQASAAFQRECLEHHASVLGARLFVEKIEWPEYARGMGYIFREGAAPDHPADPYEPLRYTEEEGVRYMRETWDFLQGRNTVFFALAGARALSMDLLTGYIGFQMDAPSWEVLGAYGDSGSDASPAYMRAFNELSWAGAFSRPFQLAAPFIDLRCTKQDIVGLGRSLGVDYSKTTSCEFWPPCGKCAQCTIRAGVLGARRLY